MLPKSSASNFASLLLPFFISVAFLISGNILGYVFISHNRSNIQPDKASTEFRGTSNDTRGRGST